MNNFEPFEKEEMYVLVAPDGSIQIGTLQEDLPTLMGWIKLLHKKGLGLSFFEMKRKGFDICQVEVTITNKMKIEQN